MTHDTVRSVQSPSALSACGSARAAIVLFVAAPACAQAPIVKDDAKPVVVPFTLLLFTLGAGMGVGKASVYKLIPDQFPRDVGAVGGLVGMLGALGGILIPLGVAPLQAATGMPSVLFGVLLALTVLSAATYAVMELSQRQAKAPAEVAEAQLV